MRFLSHNVGRHLCLLREARKCALLKLLGLTIAIEKQQVSWTLWPANSGELTLQCLADSL